MIIVEKTPTRHSSYHGESHRHHGNGENETDVDELGVSAASNGDVSPRSGSAAGFGGADGFLSKNKAMKRANRVMM